MNVRKPPQFLAYALGAALLVCMAVSWSPRFWPTAVGIVSLSIVAVMWAVRAEDVVLRPQLIPVALIGAWGAIQLALHATAIPYLTFRATLVWALCAVAFFLGSQILPGKSLEVFLELLLWAATALAVEAILQLYTGQGRVLWIFPAADSVLGTVYYRNQFAALMELTAPLALWQIGRGRAVSGGLCFAAIFAATVTSLSRAGVGLVAAELAIFIVFMATAGAWRSRSGVIAILALVAVVAGAGAVVGTEQIWNRFLIDNPYGVRRQLFDSTVAMIQRAPVAGYGLGTWRAVFPQFATFDLIVIANEAHNDWVQWASDGGFPFLALMAGLVIWLARAAFRSVWGAGLLAVAVHCYVDYPMRLPAVAFLWFAIAGALAAYRNPTTDIPPRVRV